MFTPSSPESEPTPFSAIVPPEQPQDQSASHLSSPQMSEQPASQPPAQPTVPSFDFVAVLRDSATLGREELQRMLSAAIGAGAIDFRKAVEQITEEAKSDPGLIVRAGIGQFYIGNATVAEELLTGTNDGIGRYYLGQALLSQERYEDAAKEFEQAGKLGYKPTESTLRRSGAIRRAGRLEDAEELIRSTGADGARLAEYSYQMGCILSDRGDTFGAIEYFERAVDMDPHHQRALFALAVQNSRHGDDEEAIQLYERCLSRPPYLRGALLNLGLLYEDKENYSAAQYCFERVLKYDPGNERAILYLKDIEATSDMYYDEESLKEQQRLEQLLARPVTDFELSVRSRNCLATMGIDTLGQLTEISEQELLSGKNFGETSLIEVRELMEVHGLSIGEYLHEKQREPSFDNRELTAEEQAAVQLPISDLNLSVRSRKCMARLGITTIGEVLIRTPDELLSAKNFGVTSLNEIRNKLSEMNLKLRND
ncbi:DNA-directed RNA polymerase subunit alpha C-terminal domain-containing protein [Thalassoglobus polymorphus]|uniref:DNA-directed RNA polymerase subunit alpha n=1 Tax=Thalassoglobus polymorphus TaxID=2527994 RepID=A0A517QPE4_9PLAN|nr:DNA-directed RNA polymerase subunit alpha C-terminal domain-containing protein [Thalassoglobus polymorphus]QDT33491.1 DNA-directed RNA polymerase subunit alpha [Thalassoglobus polymorphus]